MTIWLVCDMDIACDVFDQKTLKLKLGQTSLPRDIRYRLTFAEMPEDNVLDPYEIFNYYLDRCPPNAKRLYCKPCASEEAIAQINANLMGKGRPHPRNCCHELVLPLVVIGLGGAMTE